jgi:hypothetical protein
MSLSSVNWFRCNCTTGTSTTSSSHNIVLVKELDKTKTSYIPVFVCTLRDKGTANIHMQSKKK